MRDRINGMRQLLVKTLKAKGVPGDYSFITRQRGMFSFSGLTPPQVEALKQKYAIYIVGSGRINVAGITEQNVGPLCEAIAEVVKSVDAFDRTWPSSSPASGRLPPAGRRHSRGHQLADRNAASIGPCWGRMDRARRRCCGSCAAICGRRAAACCGLGQELVDLGELRRSIGWISSGMIAEIPPTDTGLETVVTGRLAQIGLKHFPEFGPTEPTSPTRPPSWRDLAANRWPTSRSASCRKASGSRCSLPGPAWRRPLLLGARRAVRGHGPRRPRAISGVAERADCRSRLARRWSW